MASFHKEPEFVIVSQVSLHLRTRMESFIARKTSGPWNRSNFPKHELNHPKDPKWYFSEISH